MSTFQFHKGTIRTLIRQSLTCSIVLFQFHKGTIRTQLSDLQFRLYRDFNSIKVRLERGQARYVVAKMSISIP